jgi:biopolymer transport protein ExbB/TolQ
MNIRVSCPECKGVMEAREELLGSMARCPYCKKAVKVERPPASNGQKPVVAEPVLQERPKAQEAPVNLELPATAIQLKEADRSSEPASAPTPPAPAVGRVKTKERPVEAALDDSAAPAGLVVATAGHKRHKRSQTLMMLKALIRRGNPTDASVVLTGAVAAGITWLAYVAIIDRLPSGNYVHDLLTERTWVAYATFYFTIWAAVVLAVKFWKIAHQHTSLTYDLLPVDRMARITPQNVDLIETHIKKLPVNPRKSFLINRVLMALDNFKARQSVPEVGAVLNTQADTDAAMMDSSYAMLKVLIWAIPILGFIGTVIGISDAVNNFTQAVQQAQDLDKVKEALGKVTQGLAVAFDTTLLGLILSMIIMFPTNWVQKAEEDLLSTVDQYCNENLLPRLATAAEVRTVQAAEQEAGLPVMMQSYVNTLQEWQKRLENLETALFERVVDALGDVRKEIAKQRPAADEVATSV